jgi:hypothetical protein
MDDSFPAHCESLPTSKMYDADWLMANNSVSFFGSCPSRDIKHVSTQSANAILQKENPARKETLLARDFAGKILSCCKRCMSPA